MVRFCETKQPCLICTKLRIFSTVTNYFVTWSCGTKNASNWRKNDELRRTEALTRGYALINLF